MTKQPILFVIFFLVQILLFSQTPNQFKYQAVLRNADGTIIANTAKTVTVEILQGSPNGMVLFIENHTVTTTAQGIINLNIGSINTTGIAAINWSADTYFVKISVEGIPMGISQLLSVPYALNAKNVENETDPVFVNSAANTISPAQINNWDNAFSWGNHATAGYLTTFSEMDPLFSNSAAIGIIFNDITNWNTAYSWGSHAGLYRINTWVPNWTEITGKPGFATVATSGNYSDLINKPELFSGSFVDLTNKPTTLIGYGIIDAMSTSHPVNDITNTNITNWNTAYGWGNHAGLYRINTWVPDWADVTGKPGFATVATSGSYSDLINKPSLFSGSFADLSNKPTTIAGYGITDAFSGSYNDLTNKPAIDGSETKITAGSNITITGTGTISNPYKINSSVINPDYSAGSGISILGNTISAKDTSSTNELQTLSIRNDTIFLSNGGFVKLPTMLLPPVALATAASDVDSFSATLNGIVNGKGLRTIIEFEWDTTISYRNSVIANQSPVTGSANIAVGKTISGLKSNTTYHFRIKATNAVDIIFSNDISFTTTIALPVVTTSNVTDIKGNSAKAGGSVADDGGSVITANGLCWSNSPNPTITDDKTTSFTDIITGLLPNTIYYVRAYATNFTGTSYGNQIIFNSGRLIGSFHNGGLVFYNDGNGHGLVCAESDQSIGTEWGCFETLIGTSTSINTGAINTNLIVTGCATDSIAAKLCFDLVLNTYNDWFLPSIDELNLMYLNLKTQSLGNFSNYAYWSSSERNGSSVWSIAMFEGNIVGFNKYFGGGKVRAVRAF